MTDDQFRDEMRAAVNEEARTAPVSADDWDRFAARLHYRRLDIAAPDQYEAWGGAVREIERAAGVEEKRVAYLAVGPDLFHDCVAALAGGGLIPADDNDAEPPWLRVVVEKPFGTDLESAKKLNADLRATLRETQLYRIDHYLGKETVQNVLMFRFGNGIFEPLFNRQHVDHVQITVSESQGHRGRPRRVLRQKRRAAGRAAKPRPAITRPGGDGAAREVCRGRHPGRKTQGSRGPPPGRGLPRRLGRRRPVRRRGR